MEEDELFKIVTTSVKNRKDYILKEMKQLTKKNHKSDLNLCMRKFAKRDARSNKLFRAAGMMYRSDKRISLPGYSISKFESPELHKSIEYLCEKVNLKQILKYLLKKNIVEEEVKILRQLLESNQIFIKSGVINFDVKDIKLTDTEDDEEYCLQDIAVMIELSNYMITTEDITSYEHRWPEYSHEYYHPHISNNSICYGDWDKTIENLYFTGRWNVLKDCLCTILRTYNQDSPYLSLRDGAHDASEDEASACCEICGDEIYEECSQYYVEDVGICCENCSCYCDICDSSHIHDDMVYIDYDDNSICQRCADEGEVYFSCDECGRYWGVDKINSDNEDRLCEDCYDRRMEEEESEVQQEYVSKPCKRCGERMVNSEYLFKSEILCRKCYLDALEKYIAKVRSPKETAEQPMEADLTAAV